MLKFIVIQNAEFHVFLVDNKNKDNKVVRLVRILVSTGQNIACNIETAIKLFSFSMVFFTFCLICMQSLSLFLVNKRKERQTVLISYVILAFVIHDINRN